MIAGFDGEEFTNEIFSWHQVNGEPGTEILPAILVTTCHPQDFAARNEFRGPSHTRLRSTGILKDRLVLIPLKALCKTETDVADIIEGIFRDIREKKALPETLRYRDKSLKVTEVRSLTPLYSSPASADWVST